MLAQSWKVAHSPNRRNGLAAQPIGRPRRLHSRGAPLPKRGVNQRVRLVQLADKLALLSRPG